VLHPSLAGLAGPAAAATEAAGCVQT
jgi:hypothetical protein